jgi:O-antigen/teichoic acid export membrane protein
MQAANRVAINTGILYVRMGITVFISLYSTRLILEALGANDFGIFGVVGGAISMFGFLNNSMAAATQRFMSYSQGAGDISRLQQIFKTSFILHLIIAVMLYIILLVVGNFLFHGVLNISHERVDVAEALFQFMIVSALFSVVSVPFDAIFNAHENMFLYALLGIIENILKLAAAFLLLSSGSDRLMLYGVLVAGISAFLLLFRFWYCFRKYPECRIDFQNIDKSLIKEMISFAGWNFLGTSTTMIAHHAQGIIMNMFFGTLVNAAQAITNQVVGQLGAFASTMQKAINPRIAKSEGAGDRERMLQATMIGCKASFFLVVLLVVPVLIEMPYIFKIWLKSIPPYTMIFCQLYLIRNIIDQLFATLISSIIAVGKIRNFQLLTSAIALIPLILTYLLFKSGYPPYTLYIVFILYSIIHSLNILYFSHKVCELSISLFLKEVVFRCVMTLLSLFLIAILPQIFVSEGLYRMIAVCFATIIGFVFSVWCIGLNMKERSLIQHLGELIIDRFLLRTKRLFTLIHLKTN